MRGFESHLYPPFMAHGIVPTVDTPLRFDRFPTDHDAEEFKSQGTTTHSGRQCESLKLTLRMPRRT